MNIGLTSRFTPIVVMATVAATIFVLRIAIDIPAIHWWWGPFLLVQTRYPVTVAIGAPVLVLGIVSIAGLASRYWFASIMGLVLFATAWILCAKLVYNLLSN